MRGAGYAGHSRRPTGVFYGFEKKVATESAAFTFSGRGLARHNIHFNAEAHRFRHAVTKKVEPGLSQKRRFFFTPSRYYVRLHGLDE